ncbi:MAG: hypothetical protein ACYCST_21800 [Acidimicrobiales bacterium]
MDLPNENKMTSQNQQTLQTLPSELQSKIFGHFQFPIEKRISSQFNSLSDIVTENRINELNKQFPYWQEFPTKALVHFTKEGNLDKIKFILHYADKTLVYYQRLANIAAEYGYVRILHFLNKRSKLDWSLIAAFGASYGYINIVEYAEHQTIEPIDWNLVAIYSARTGRLSFIKYARGKGIGLSHAVIVNAVQNNHLNVVKYILNTTNISGFWDEYIPENWNNIAHISLYNGYFKLFKYIETQTSVLNWGYLASFVSIKGDLDMFIYFENKANGAIDYNSAILIAARNGNIPIINYIKDKIQVIWPDIAIQGSIGGHFNVVDYSYSQNPGSFTNEQLQNNADEAAKNGNMDIIKFIELILNRKHSKLNWNNIAIFSAKDGQKDILQYALFENYKEQSSGRAPSLEFNWQVIIENTAASGKLDLFIWFLNYLSKIIDVKTLAWTAILNSSMNRHTIKFINYISNNFRENINYNEVSSEAAVNDNLKIIIFIERLIGTINMDWQLIAEIGASSDNLRIVKFAAEENAKKIGTPSLENALNWNDIVLNSLENDDLDILKYADEMSNGNLDWNNIADLAIETQHIELIRYLVSIGHLSQEFLTGLEENEPEEDFE